MRTPRQWKRDFYIATKKYGDVEYDENGKPIDSYDKPVGFKGNDGVNYQPLSSKGDIEMYGATSKEVAKAVIIKGEKAYNYFNEDLVGSLVYLFDSSPNKKPIWDFDTTGDTEPINGFWANYEVDAVLTLLEHKNVFFKRKKRTGVN